MSKEQLVEQKQLGMAWGGTCGHDSSEKVYRPAITKLDGGRHELHLLRCMFTCIAFFNACVFQLKCCLSPQPRYTHAQSFVKKRSAVRNLSFEHKHTFYFINLYFVRFRKVLDNKEPAHAANDVLLMGLRSSVVTRLMLF